MSNIKILNDSVQNHFNKLKNIDKDKLKKINIDEEIKIDKEFDIIKEELKKIKIEEEFDIIKEELKKIKIEEEFDIIKLDDLINLLNSFNSTINEFNDTSIDDNIKITKNILLRQITEYINKIDLKKKNIIFENDIDKEIDIIEKELKNINIDEEFDIIKLNSFNNKLDELKNKINIVTYKAIKHPNTDYNYRRNYNNNIENKINKLTKQINEIKNEINNKINPLVEDLIDRYYKINNDNDKLLKLIDDINNLQNKINYNSKITKLKNSITEYINTLTTEDKVKQEYKNKLFYYENKEEYNKLVIKYNIINENINNNIIDIKTFDNLYKIISDTNNYLKYMKGQFLPKEDKDKLRKLRDNSDIVKKIDDKYTKEIEESNILEKSKRIIAVKKIKEDLIKEIKDLKEKYNIKEFNLNIDILDRKIEYINGLIPILKN